MEKIVIERILALFFGNKYYVNIINTRGTDKCEATSFIHRSKAEALQHRRSIESTLSFSYVETVSFRSRLEY